MNRIGAALFVAAGTALGQQYVISTVAGGVPAPTPVLGRAASVQPFTVAVDDSGSTYFTSGQCVYKLDANGMLTLFAGNSRRGFSGDGGPAVDAQLAYPGALAADGRGNVYIADISNGRVRKVSAAGIITTFAGFSQSNFITGLAADKDGDVYIADSLNHLIREVTLDGTIRTIAGNGSAGNSGDGGPAIEAAIGEKYGSIEGIALDSNGALYVAVDHVIRRVASGIITTVAGNGTEGMAGDGGSALDAQLSTPSGVAVDSAGNLYIADGARIREVSPGGIITTAVGTGVQGYSGDNGPAAAAQIGMAWVSSIAVDSSGHLLIADVLSNRLRKAEAGGIITTVAGTGMPFYAGDGGPASRAQLGSPFFVTTDRFGNLLISDYMGQMVRRMSPDGRIETIAGVGSPVIDGAVGDGQMAISAHLGRVSGVVSDSSGNVFVADSDNATVWKIGLDGVIHRFAGNGSLAHSGDGGPAVNAGLITPWGLALDGDGNLYIADENDHRVRRVSADGIISTFAGNGRSGYSGDGGPAAAASFSGPRAVAVDASGNVYIADTGNARVRKVSAGGTITTVVGTGKAGFAGDGGPAAAAQTNAQSVAVDGEGNLYVSDSWLIREVSADQIIHTIAGNLSSGNNYTGDCGPATSADFAADGLTISDDGTIYFADGYNSAVRELRPAGPRESHESGVGVATAAGCGSEEALGRVSHRLSYH